VLTSLISLAIVFYFADLREMIRAIQGANLALVSLAILISFTWLLVRAICWRILLQNKASYWQVFLNVN